MMSIPTQYGLNVNTPEPLQITIDVSERTLIAIAFVSIVAAVAIKQLKRG
ncbi:hypothetical protein [Vibrio viridaestus]|nr:hypothetical protein [Vibrio viridaestus]